MEEFSGGVLAVGILDGSVSCMPYDRAVGGIRSHSAKLPPAVRLFTGLSPSVEGV